jgi:hypothetical protein
METKEERWERIRNGPIDSGWGELTDDDIEKLVDEAEKRSKELREEDLDWPPQKPWLEPFVTKLLKERKETLNSWRRQIPALSGRAKNFENWLVVELVDRICKSGKARDIRTNGHFEEGKIPANEVDGLSGRKGEAVHLSPDISIRLKERLLRRGRHTYVWGGGEVVSGEIKTGLAPKELLNDVKIVRHYKKKGVCEIAEFIWVVLLPEGEKEARSSLQSFEKVFHKMQQDFPEVLWVRKSITPWLILVVGVIGRVTDKRLFFPDYTKKITEGAKKINAILSDTDDLKGDSSSE